MARHGGQTGNFDELLAELLDFLGGRTVWREREYRLPCSRAVVPDGRTVVQRCRQRLELCSEHFEHFTVVGGAAIVQRRDEQPDVQFRPQATVRLQCGQYAWKAIQAFGPGRYRNDELICGQRGQDGQLAEAGWTIDE